MGVLSLMYNGISLLLFFCLLHHASCRDIITTFAGGASYIGDGGAATSAAIYYVYGVVLDSSGTNNGINIIFKCSHLVITCTLSS